MKKLFSFVSAFILLTLVQSSFASAIHAVPGGSFETVNIDFRSSILTNGTDQALTLWVRTWNTSIVPGYPIVPPLGDSPLSTYFFINFTSRLKVSNFYVLVRNFSARHPYPALVYRDPATGVLRYDSEVGPDPGWPQIGIPWTYAVYNGQNCARKGVWFMSNEPRSWMRELIFWVCPSNVYVELVDIGPPPSGTVGKWLLQFNSQRYQYALALENVQYQRRPGGALDVSGGFISPSGSLLRGYRGLLPRYNVLIEYAYPTR